MLGALVLGTACGEGGDGEQPSTDGTTPTSTQGTTVDASTALPTMADATTPDPSGDEDPTTTPTDDTADDDTPTTGDSSSDGGESSTGEPPIQLCGLEDLKPGAPNPIISGPEPMMIPPDIGQILVDNCGCHYADMLAVGPPIADYSSTLPFKIETWEQWQGTYGMGMNVKNTLDVALERVRDSPVQFTMPQRACYVGGGERMIPADRETLIDWMVAGAPDGATWVP